MPDANTAADHREDYVTVAGCRTFVMRGGKGKTLLFLHGAGGGGVWLPCLQDLAQRFDIVAPEHPGFGRTDTPDWLDNIHDLAYFYLDFLKALNLKDVHLAGISFGGWIAAEVAVRATDRIASLCLIDAAGLKVPGVERADIFLWNHEESVRNLFFDPKLAEAVLARQLPEIEQDYQTKNRFTVAKIGWQPRLHDPDFPKWLHRIDVPTLVMWGREDKLNPVAVADHFAKLIPGARKHIFERCGHLPHVESKDEFVRVYNSFVADIKS
jgi:pimeloyl-ACP methyl ester carboxylesterase